MTVALDHVILPTTDQAASAAFVAKMLGLPQGMPVGHFICIPLSNGVTVDVMASGDHQSVHLAFLVDDDTFGARTVQAESNGWASRTGIAARRPGG
jgi:catechol 2,3-dioxygenase-like lactoylglutathione lyase family enzyme